MSGYPLTFIIDMETVYHRLKGLPEVKDILDSTINKLLNLLWGNYSSAKLIVNYLFSENN